MTSHTARNSKGTVAAAMSKKKTFYETLGVNPKATLQDIKMAYRQRARVAHPDLHRDRNTQVRKLADEQIRVLNEAYSILIRKEKRSLYDDCLEQGLDYYEAEVASRPETEVERQIREAEEHLETEGLTKSSDEALSMVERLIPAARWRRIDPSDPYFDAVTTGQSGPQKFTVWSKALSQLSAADIPGVAQYAEALLGSIRPGLIREHHSYLLLGRTLEDIAGVKSTVREFNTRNFTSVAGRAPRCLLAFASIEDGVVMVPGVISPEPPLSSLRLSLEKHFKL